MFSDTQPAGLDAFESEDSFKTPDESTKTPDTASTVVSETASTAGEWLESITPALCADAESGTAKFTESMLLGFENILEKYGTVGQYLRARYPTVVAQQQFVDSLVHLSKLLPSQHVESTIDVRSPDNLSSSPTIFHVAAFSFSTSASLKPDPDNSVSRELAAQILQDGFATSLEPIVATQSAEVLLESQQLKAPWDGTLLPMSLGYSKGKSRMFVLHVILSMVMDSNIELDKAICPRVVCCRRQQLSS